MKKWGFNQSASFACESQTSFGDFTRIQNFACNFSTKEFYMQQYRNILNKWALKECYRSIRNSDELNTENLLLYRAWAPFTFHFRIIGEWIVGISKDQMDVLGLMWKYPIKVLNFDKNSHVLLRPQIVGGMTSRRWKKNLLRLWQESQLT